jgi:hypothetical protein
MNELEPRRPPSSVEEAVATLADDEYFAWCRRQAEQLFASLIARRFPHLVPHVSPQSRRERRRVA